MILRAWQWLWTHRLLVGVSVAVAVWASGYESPPLDQRLSEPPLESTRLLDRNGQLLRELPAAHGRFARWVDLTEVSPHILAATLFSEDRRFFEHGGVDPRAVARAASDNTTSLRVVSGASTITMQLVRMLEPRERGLTAKVLESWDALRLEETIDKDTILLHYLNRVPYGHGAIGVESASRLFFGKPARAVSLAEAALLAVLPRSPEGYSPYRHLDRAKSRQEVLLEAMAAHGVVSASDASAAIAEPLTLVPWSTPFHAPHFTTWIATAQCPSQSGGAITTTLDLELQHAVERHVTERLVALRGRDATNAAVLVVDNETGEILAWVGSGDFDNASHDGQVDGVLAQRQPGSTLKPFTYALAIESGRTAATIIPDIRTRYAMTDGRSFVPRNYDQRLHGPVRLREALASSLNVAAIRVASWVGSGPLLSRLRRLGFDQLLRDARHYGLGLTVGNGEVSLLELVGAFVTLARGGYRTPLVALRPGSPPEGPPERVLDSGASWLVTHILSDAMARIRGFGLATPFNFPFPVAVKTGTSNNWRDNWTVGYTPQVTVGVWVGNFDGRPMRQSSGSSGAGPLFRDAMLSAMRGREPRVFRRPERRVERVPICPVSGRRPGPHCPHRYTEVFLGDSSPVGTCDYHREIAIDRRNGLLAGPGCPSEHTRSQAFVVYPPEYAEWAAGQGLARPPTEHSPFCGPPASPTAAASAVVARAAGPRLLSPSPGGRYLIDPSFSRRYQALPLKAVVPPDAQDVVWMVDGKPFATVDWPYRSLWALAEGEHTFQVVADGRASAVARITVR